MRTLDTSKGGRERAKGVAIAAALLVGVVYFHGSADAQPSLLEQGRTALQQGDVDRAVSLLEKAVAEQPENAQAHYWLGDAYGREALRASIFRRLSYAKRTRQEFEHAVQLDPDYVDARFALVQFYTMAPGFVGGSTAKAYSQAAEIAARNPEKGRMAVAFVQTHGKSAGMPQSLDDPAVQQAAHSAPK